MAVQFTILGSGSGGNCAYLETGETRLLIDAGFSGRQIRERLASIGRTPESLNGILLTHEHSDHIQGLTGLCSKLKIPICCNRLTREAVELQLEIKLECCHLFTTGSSFDIGDVRIDTFSIPHDAYDPVGYMLHAGGHKIGFLTDLGHATRLVCERVRASNVLVLETNHDLKMLQDDPRRPWSLKQRISSRHGHLSNEAAAEALQTIVHADLRHVFLGHLSRDCNRPELAREVIAKKMDVTGANHVAIHSTSQAKRCETLALA